MEGVTYLIRKTLRHWWTEHQHAGLEDLSQRAEWPLELLGRWPQHRETNNAKSPKHHGNRRKSNPRRRHVMNVEGRALPRGSRRHSSSLPSRRCPPPQEVRRNSSSSEGFSPRGTGTSTSDIIALLESGNFSLEVTTTMNLTPCYHVCMDQGHKTSRCLQITSLEKFIQTKYKNYLD